MKKFKRFASVVMVIMMMLSMMIPAMAADETGTITINGATGGKVYEVYKIFDLTYSPAAEGETVQHVAYTIASNWTDFFAEGAPGASYIVAEDNTGNLSSITVDGKVKYINITESNVGEFAQKAMAWCVDGTPAADDTKTAEEGATTVKFTDLPLGYYLVYPQGATDIAESYASICSLSSTIPDATVNVKATYPEIEKTVDDASVEIGQTVTYTITGQVPNTNGYTKYDYTVTDTMSEGLTFNKDVTVKFGETMIIGDQTTDSEAIEYTDSGFTLYFDMTEYQTYVGQDIVITYTATVNENAVVNVTTNKAKLEYSNDPSDETSKEKTPVEEVPVYSSKIDVTKVDGSDNTTKLAGAEFVLVKKTTTTGEDTSTTTTETFYKYTEATTDMPAKVEWVNNIANATVLRTDEKGTVTFTGLEDGTYYLRETKAPEGYNLLTEDKEVEVIHTNDTTINKPIGVTVSTTVENNAGSQLPTTGGIGTTIFYCLGGAMVLGAFVLLITKKRMSREM